MKAKLIALNARFTHSCLALFYIRHELQQNCPDLDVELFQYTINDPYYEMLLRIGNGNPEYILISTLVWNSELVEKLIRDLRVSQPQAHFIIGGPQAEVVGAHVGSKRCTVVKGEIEAISKSFYQDLLQQNLQPQYSGHFLKQKQCDLLLPYTDEDFELHLKNRHIYYESSRGCPFSCTYCLSSAEKGLFHKPVEQVFQEIDTILSHNPEVVRFVDRTFNDIPERAYTIWKYLAEKDCSTLFHFEVAPDRFTDEIIKYLIKVPNERFQLEIGIQSTNDDTLKAINRPVDPIVAHKAIQGLNKGKNFHIHVDLILGLPFETKETFAKSFRDVFAMAPHYIQMGLLKVLPDTHICHAAEDYGYEASSNPPYSILSTKWLDHEKLTELYWFSECVEKFMNNRYFVSLWDYLRENDDDIFSFFEKTLAECQKKNFFHLAATHELMGSILVDCCSKRDDANLIFELMQYDWFRCGHRFFPKFLNGLESLDNDVDTMQELKKKLFFNMVDEYEGLYTKHGKSKFFKRSIFLSFSEEALLKFGHEKKQGTFGVICIRHEREDKVHALCETVCI